MQHNMSFENIRITNIFFSINNKYKEKAKPIAINHEVALASTYKKTKKILTILLKVSLSKGDIPFTFEIEGEGTFSFKKQPEDSMLEQYSTINCPAIMFPYIRETIADITRRSGYPPMHMSPINFVEFSKTFRQVDKPSKPSKKLVKSKKK